MDTDVINVSSSKLIFVGDPPFSGKRRRNRAVSRRAPALPDGPLTGHTCQRQLKPRRAPMSPTQKCLHARSFIYLSIFTFVRGDAPRSRQCQTPNPRPCHQPNATTPPARLHGASKKQKAGRGGGGERVFLNNNSFGQHRAGCRGETICVVTRPLGEKRAHTMRRLEEGTEELSALRVWGRRAARRGGAE